MSIILAAICFAMNAIYVTEAMRCFQCSYVPHLEDCEIVTQCGSDEICYVEQIVNTTTGHVTFNSGCRSRENCGKLSGRSTVVPGNSTRTGGQTGAVGRRSDSPVCEQCCDTEFCNNQGCHETATPLDQRGPYCFSCRNQYGQQSCRNVTQCGQYQACFIRKTLTINGSLYDGQCMHKTICESIKLALSIIGKRSIEDVRVSSHLSRGINSDQLEITSLSRRVTRNDQYCVHCCESDFCNDSCMRNHA